MGCSERDGKGCLGSRPWDGLLAGGRASPDVETAVGSFLRGPLDDVCSFGRIIPDCSNLARTGCLLCWMVVQTMNGCSGLVSLRASQTIRSMIAAKTGASSLRRKGEALPFRLGELEFLKRQLERMSYAEAVAEEFIVQHHLDAWLFLATIGLNYLAGAGAVLQNGAWTKMEKLAVENLRASILRRCSNDTTAVTSLEEVEKDLLSKRVGYEGEEVSVCHQITLEQVMPSLPPHSHGGAIQALDWVGSTSRRFLLNPEECLVVDPIFKRAKIPGKVHVKPGEELGLAQELVARGVCVWHPLEDIHCIEEAPLLNGLFGVPKSGTVNSGAPILRLIMNLIPSNCCLQQLQGKVDSLPGICSWHSVFMEDGEELRLFQSDMSSAFYLFALPAVWYRYLGFNIVVDGYEIGKDGAGRWALCCAVIPMGWSSSVGLMQEISENLLLRGGLDPRHQIRRGTTLPTWMVGLLGEAKLTGSYWWHVYLDNFCAAERLVPKEASVAGAECHRLAEQIWKESGVLSSEKKRKAYEARIEELGAEIDGVEGTLGGSAERLRKVILATIWLLHQKYLKRKHVQIVAGRWVFLMQFRRPSMSIFNAVWSFVGSTTEKKRYRLEAVRAELLMAIFLGPLLHSYLKAPVAQVITASDASSTRGAVSVARSLTSEGQDFVGGSLLADSQACTAPFIVVSLFNGIGGAFRCYDICGVRPRARIAFDTCKESNRVTQKRWPDVQIYHDVRDLGPATVRKWRLQFGDIEEIHLWGGFPCVDLSSAKANRRNLEGPGSSLFWEIPRILGLLEAEFKATVKIKFCLENVASMDLSATVQISEALQTKPFRLDCWQAVPMHRPRFAWCSERIEGHLEGLEFTSDRFWTDVKAVAPYPETSQWIQPGKEWKGEGVQAVFPTCMKSIPRVAPPPKPAGLDRCNEATINRWVSDEFRFPPYQYREQFLITSEDSWRLLSPVERELLLGYGYRHTAVCLSASDIKSNNKRYEDCRLSLLGDSFSIYSFVIFAFSLAIRYVTRVPYSHLCNRMGMAPGFLAPIRLLAPLGRCLKYGSPPNLGALYQVQQLNRILLKRTDHTGSDVRLTSGEPLSSKIFPRQAVSAQWWTWEPAFHLRWKQKSHINLLELEAIFLAIKFQVSRLGISQSRIFHISDSYVCLSIISKGRSGSNVLQRKLKQIAAFLLSFGLQIIVGHVESTENPTDAASRA